MRVLVCGGRDYTDAGFLNAKLDHLRETTGLSVLIEGEAPGADALARDWADSRGIWVEKYPADWGKYGRAAGPIRNKRMLDDGMPELVVAFPGGRGTENMVQQALSAGVPVMRVGT